MAKLHWGVGIAAGLLWLGCPPPVPPDPDGGEPPPDPCNTVQDALTKLECRIPLDGTAFTDHIGTPGDVDWFRIELPAGLTQRDLIQVQGVYLFPQTAVN